MNAGVRDLLYSGGFILGAIILNLMAWLCWYNLPLSIAGWLASTFWVLSVGWGALAIVFLARP